ncbi:hypothetical protein [Brevibacillus laterosporus]|uniref:Uncharacterized protein n=1 Tax=Brevibacillus laterosporus TaxID=1465 RepID=A0AAP3DEN0_BRELA|nr:hypothetical protein [Brevibacillus laterosporus]MCR8979498.1 hypothetical protein [Brevibacillus laterosporus]MCZ0806653.1 hypothetical protein [Brevibacillus laterosporus]MCZ0825101.1 hypothetical protein [Brevibacillus laterosporus]MCZ0852061.1 hypothetical protein [Brevibacillus laterosporus]PPB10884.1 hypothetical protein C4A77_04465 [Brevibacillus laterosporus]
MGTYARIKPETEAWDLMNKIFTSKEKWIENREEIESFLGFPMDGNLYININYLVIERKMVKPEWEMEFRKNSHPAVTKVKSKLRKQWVDLCKRLGLEAYQTSDFYFKFGLWGTPSLYHSINSDYFIEFDGDVDLGPHEWAEEVNEPEFLRLRADWIEKSNSSNVESGNIG